MSMVHPLLYAGDKIEFILKITTVHCVTRVVAQKTRFNNICKFPRNNPIQNPPFSFSNAQTSTNLDADFRLIYWRMDYEPSTYTQVPRYVHILGSYFLMRQRKYVPNLTKRPSKNH